jgi:hypothetical protein
MLHPRPLTHELPIVLLVLSSYVPILYTLLLSISCSTDATSCKCMSLLCVVPSLGCWSTKPQDTQAFGAEEWDIEV